MKDTNKRKRSRITIKRGKNTGFSSVSSAISMNLKPLLSTSTARKVEKKLPKSVPNGK